MKSSDNLIFPKNGRPLISLKVLRKYLDPSQIADVEGLRKRLLEKMPDLQEKFNKKSKYLGYRRKDESDCLYLYLQRKRIVVDLRIDPQLLNGFEVKHRENYQGKSGWLTGWRIPYMDFVVSTMLKPRISEVASV
jgi:hypothetical protein